LSERAARERGYYDNFVLQGGSEGRSLLDRFSRGFYHKGEEGRLWGPVWRRIDLQGSAVLDYCCGNGAFSRLLAGLGAQVQGVDISPELIKQAREHASAEGMNGDSPRFLVGDAQQLPFEDNRFDYVLGNGVLHHLDLDKAYPEIARVLKPGGRAIFQEPMYHHPALWCLRRMTPKLHTADERPLNMHDIEKAGKWFRSCSHHEHFLFSVIASPAHLFGQDFVLSLIDKLDRFDERLMNAQPWLRRYAWFTTLELEK
jgi:SAM-dependent methyltransferase